MPNEDHVTAEEGSVEKGHHAITGMKQRLTRGVLEGIRPHLEGLKREVSGAEGEQEHAWQPQALVGVKEVYHNARDRCILLRSSDRDPFANMDRAKLMKDLKDDQAPSVRNIGGSRSRRDSLQSLRSIEKQLARNRLVAGNGISMGRTNRASKCVPKERRRPDESSILASIDESKQDQDNSLQSQLASSSSLSGTRTSCSLRDGNGNSLIIDTNKRQSVISELGLSSQNFSDNLSISQFRQFRTAGDDMLNYDTGRPHA